MISNLYRCSLDLEDRFGVIIDPIRNNFIIGFMFFFRYIETCIVRRNLSHTEYGEMEHPSTYIGMAYINIIMIFMNSNGTDFCGINDEIR